MWTFAISCWCVSSAFQAAEEVKVLIAAPFSQAQGKYLDCCKVFAIVHNSSGRIIAAASSVCWGPHLVLAEVTGAINLRGEEMPACVTTSLGRSGRMAASRTARHHRLYLTRRSRPI